MTDPSRNERLDIGRRTFAVLGAILVILTGFIRHRYAHYDVFWDGDQAIVATGIISLERGVSTRLYNYPEQIGYFELGRLLLRITPGEDPTRIRELLVGVSVVSGVLIVALSLLIFSAELSRRSRLLVALVMLVSPIVWRLSGYGHSGLPSCTFLIAAFVVASRVPGIRGLAAACALQACAILVRGDAALAALGFAYYASRRKTGSLWQGGFVLLWTAAVLGVVKWVTASRSIDTVPLSEIVFNTEWPAHYLTYFFWGIGPATLLYTAAGWPALFRKPVLTVTFVLWCLPVVAFYLPWATTPRYVLQLTVPIAVCAALGIGTILASLGRRHWLIRIPAIAAVFVVLLWHLVFVQRNYVPGRFHTWLVPYTYTAHDGPHPYGALLMESPANLPVTGLPVNRGAATLAAMAGAEAGLPKRWAIIVDFWDDIYANAFFLIAQTGAPYHEAEGFRFNIGSLTLDFVFRGSLEPLQASGPLRDKARKRLLDADRVFRQRAGGVASDPVLPLLRSAFGPAVSFTEIGSSQLSEVHALRP